MSTTKRSPPCAPSFQASGEIRQLESTVGRDGRVRAACRRRSCDPGAEFPQLSVSGSVFCHSSERTPELPDACVALTVTSPPYNVGIPYGGAEENDQRPFGAYLAMLRRVFAEVFRVTVDGGRCCINVANTGRNPYVPLSSHLDLTMEKLGWWMRGHIVWMKADTPNGTAWGSFGSASNPCCATSTSTCWSTARALPRFRAGAAHDGEPGVHGGGTQHLASGTPTAATVIIQLHSQLKSPRRLIQLYSFPDNLVLDPFAGSGTTLAAAAEMHRRCVGYKLDPGVCRDRVAIASPAHCTTSEIPKLERPVLHEHGPRPPPHRVPPGPRRLAPASTGHGRGPGAQGGDSGAGPRLRHSCGFAGSNCSMAFDAPRPSSTCWPLRSTGRPDDASTKGGGTSGSKDLQSDCGACARG